jgi:hypothetical protein
MRRDGILVKEKRRKGEQRTTHKANRWVRRLVIFLGTTAHHDDIYVFW